MSKKLLVVGCFLAGMASFGQNVAFGVQAGIPILRESPLILYLTWLLLVCFSVGWLILG